MTSDTSGNDSSGKRYGIWEEEGGLLRKNDLQKIKGFCCTSLFKKEFVFSGNVKALYSNNMMTKPFFFCPS